MPYNIMALNTHAENEKCVRSEISPKKKLFRCVRSFFFIHFWIFVLLMNQRLCVCVHACEYTRNVNWKPNNAQLLTTYRLFEFIFSFLIPSSMLYVFVLASLLDYTLVWCSWNYFFFVFIPNDVLIEYLMARFFFHFFEMCERKYERYFLSFVSTSHWYLFDYVHST